MTKSKSSTGPSKAALPYLNQASGALNNAYNPSQIQGIESTLTGQIPTVLGQTLNNPALGAASSYDQDVLSGKYLGAGNPYLNQQIADTDASVTDNVNAGLGTRGLAGGSAASAILASQLAKNETNLRYNDYTQERQNMNAAAGNATSVAGAQDSGIQALLAYLTGTAELPIDAASKYASGIGDLWSKSTTTTTTPSALSSVLGVAGTAAKVAGAFSDRRLKTDIVKIGEASDGLGIYNFKYVGSDQIEEGVMADEVAQLRPWALGAPVGGYATVHYGLL